MKRILLLITLFFTLFNFSYGQLPTTCANMDPICSNSGLNFTAESSGGNAENGNNYGCLNTQPNPTWYYIQVANSGPINMTLSAGSDVDYILYGPYSSLSNAQSYCGNMGAASSGSSANAIVNCSYSTSATETPHIPNAVAGQVYVLLITNYASVVQNVTLTQSNYGTAGAGSTDCSIISPCSISSLNTTIGACNPATNTFNLTGTIGVLNPPTTGTLIAKDCNGNQVTVATAPFSASSYNFAINNISSDGAACSVQVYFSADIGCTQSTSYTNPSACTTAPTTSPVSYCNGDVASALSATGSNLLWYTTATGGVGSSTAPTPSTATSGTTTYYVSQTSGGFESPRTPITVTVNPLPNVDAGSDMVLTCTTTQVILNGSSSTTGATFSWTGGTIVSGSTTAATTVSADGTYTLTVTDPTNGCTATDNVNVTLNNTPPNVDAGTDKILTCTTTQVNLNGSSSTAGATFNWTGGTIVSNGTTAAPTVSADGTYTLTVTDPTNGCTATDNVDVTLNNTPPNADAGTDQTLTCSSPSLTLNGSSSTAGATFNWTGGTIVSGGTTATPTVSTAGTYTLTVTNPTNGCTATDNVDVSVAMGVPNVDAGSDMVLTCTTTQVNLNGSSSTAGVTFNWTGGTIVSGGTTATPTVSAANTYTLTVTDPTNGCTATDNVDVTLNNTPPNVDAGSDMILTCTTTQVNLNGSSSTAGATFNWTGGTIVSNGTTAAPTVSADGTYTLTVTDPTNGCTATDNVDVTLNNTPPNVDAGTDKILTCTTTQVNLNGSSSTAGATFSWTGGTPVSGGTTTTPTINTAGTYTMTVTDPTNGCTATDNVDVTLNNTPPNVDAGTDQTLTCSSPSLTLNGSSSTAGATFNWTGGTIVSGGTTPTPTVNTPGTYTLTVTDPTNGCTSTDNTTVNEAEGTPNVNAGSDQTINCTTTQVTLNGSSSTSGVTFSWSGGTIVSGGTTATPTVNTAGTYTLTVTDPTNGCTATNTVTVSTDTIHPNVTANGATVCAGESVTLSAQGASTYSWNGGINNGVAFVPTGDTTYYTVTGTNANGCTGTYTVSVIANPYPTAILSGTPLTGNPTLDVSFTNASLGANSFTWDFGEGATISENSTLGESHSYTSTGNYFVILTADNKGCIDTAMLEVIVIPFGPVGYHIPNIITPNGDGQNDYFVFNLVNAKALNVQIFNRWGNPIITLDDVDTKGWDGKTKSGTDVDEGTYFFLYKITGINGDVVNGQGFVQVQRN